MVRPGRPAAGGGRSAARTWPVRLVSGPRGGTGTAGRRFRADRTPAGRRTDPPVRSLATRGQDTLQTPPRPPSDLSRAAALRESPIPRCTCQECASTQFVRAECAHSFHVGSSDGNPPKSKGVAVQQPANDRVYPAVSLSNPGCGRKVGARPDTPRTTPEAAVPALRYPPDRPPTRPDRGIDSDTAPADCPARAGHAPPQRRPRAFTRRHRKAASTPARMTGRRTTALVAPPAEHQSPATAGPPVPNGPHCPGDSSSTQLNTPISPSDNFRPLHDRTRAADDAHFLRQMM